MYPPSDKGSGRGALHHPSPLLNQYICNKIRKLALERWDEHESHELMISKAILEGGLKALFIATKAQIYIFFIFFHIIRYKGRILGAVTKNLDHHLSGEGLNFRAFSTVALR